MKSLIKVISAVVVLVVSANAYASKPYFWTDYTLSRDCGRFGHYVGPNKASVHGGVCLYFSEGAFNIHTSYTLDKNCSHNGVYGGPNRADLHGGYCIWADGYTLKTTYTLSKSCGMNAVYVGPNKVSAHGGYCLEVLY